MNNAPLRGYPDSGTFTTVLRNWPMTYILTCGDFKHSKTGVIGRLCALLRVAW